MEKIAYLFPSFPTEKEVVLANVGQPNLALKVNEFPSEFSFLAASGLVNIDPQENYVISVDLSFNDVLVTDPNVASPMICHKSITSKEGYYASTFAVPLTAKVSAPGVYDLKLMLYKIVQGKKVLLDESESKLIVSQEWIS
ncbi:hypothetical protein R950_002596 [Salmonella enterica subsp. enterica]|nr:hypothetical protein [Salmonella enterica subsp. enterica serovar Langford]